MCVCVCIKPQRRRLASSGPSPGGGPRLRLPQQAFSVWILNNWSLQAEPRRAVPVCAPPPTPTPRRAHTQICVHMCGGLTVRSQREAENIYHVPKQKWWWSVLNGPACLEKPFSKWMPLSTRASDGNPPRAIPSGNKIASPCALFLNKFFLLRGREE